MATSRTGTAQWKRRRKQAIDQARANGQTRCGRPGCGRWLDFNTHGKPDSPEVNHDVPYVVSGIIAPPLHELTVWCRECNGSDGGKAGAAQRGRGDGIKSSQAW